MYNIYMYFHYSSMIPYVLTFWINATHGLEL